MIEIADVYAAINDGQGWVTVAYLVEKLTFRGIHVNNAAIRRLWLGHMFPANENVIVVALSGKASPTIEEGMVK